MRKDLEGFARRGVVVPLREMEGGDEGCGNGEEVAGEDSERGRARYVGTGG